jgi:hypothetical protein
VQDPEENFSVFASRIIEYNIYNIFFLLLFAKHGERIAPPNYRMEKSCQLLDTYSAIVA